MNPSFHPEIDAQMASLMGLVGSFGAPAHRNRANALAITLLSNTSLQFKDMPRISLAYGYASRSTKSTHKETKIKRGSSV